MLYDDIYQITYTDRFHKRYGANSSDIINLRKDMIKANINILSKEVMITINELLNDKDFDVSQLINLIRLPFPIMWIETAEGTGPKTAYLFKETDIETGFWSCSLYGTNVENIISPIPYVLEYNDKGHSDCDLNYTLIDKSFNINFNKICKQYFETRIRFVNKTIDQNPKVLSFIVTVLALFNNFASKEIIRQTGTSIPGKKRLHQTPIKECNLIKLNLPKKNYIKYITSNIKRIAHEKRKLPLHDVIGHFRQLREKGKPTVACLHIPTMVENGLGICTKCERLVRWIPAHEKGDENLGRLDKRRFIISK